MPRYSGKLTYGRGDGTFRRAGWPVHSDISLPAGTTSAHPLSQLINQLINSQRPRYSGKLTYGRGDGSRARRAGSCRIIGCLSTPLVRNSREERRGEG